MHDTHLCRRCLATAQQLSSLRLSLLSARLMLWFENERLSRKAGFNPEQPRDDAGRWTDGSRGGGDQTRVAEVYSGRDKYSVLLADEKVRGGHAIEVHVAKSDAELIARLLRDRGDSLFISMVGEANGSFASLEAANDFVNRVLERNAPIVDLVSNGSLAKAFLQERFGYITGKEAFRPPGGETEPYIRPTYEVGVYIVHDIRSPRGYTVRTAYPMNKRLGY